MKKIKLFQFSRYIFIESMNPLLEKAIIIHAWRMSSTNFESKTGINNSYIWNVDTHE